MEPNESTKTADPLVGQLINGRFRILSRIARGGMGAVYKAEQSPLGRLVALKVLSPAHDVNKDPEFRKRFFREAATVAKLTHPHTVTVFDYGESEGIYFIVMELLTGVTLKQALRTAKLFPPERAIHVAKQMCRSLREAHRLGIVHRDMKPGNVMLLEQGDEKDFVKLLDFGLVKDTSAEEEDELTQAGVFMGSPKYMSPEQIQGERVDGRSDLYSLGIVLYEMLTGRTPFERDKHVQTLMDHLNAPVPPMDTPAGAPSVPPDVQQIVLKCLAKKRDERFPDVETLLSALKVLDGEALLSDSSTEIGLTDPPPVQLEPVATPVTEVRPRSNPPVGSSPPARPKVPAHSKAPSDPPITLTAPQPMPAPERTGSWLLWGLAMVTMGVVAGVLVFVVARALWPRSSAPTVAPEPAALAPAALPHPSSIAPRTLVVGLTSTPPGASVQIGSRHFGPTPTEAQLTGPEAVAGRDITMVFSIAGYRNATVTQRVPPQGPLHVSVHLHAQGARVAGDPPPPGYRGSPY